MNTSTNDKQDFSYDYTRPVNNGHDVDEVFDEMIPIAQDDIDHREIYAQSCVH